MKSEQLGERSKEWKDGKEKLNVSKRNAFCRHLIHQAPMKQFITKAQWCPR